ncbi:probable leucine-rich repeat receptor-like serine/threonine-protein kinase At3g14840 [Cynara cardunculus var. scolymus]|uniref:probable leucine-rich repeat receptor-like serine/threonine-protein kinase At3g14840 n=1 Tax=Cynara cardunculus var. scolymus TaxID=59895 RepID=UPI000D62FB53|nr:probable leucine-rich repeat receptor-like serine/threonine-protein kinase At3g14840 [Cynara cardunculus var. scolymus]
MLLGFLCIALLPLGFVSIGTACLPSDEVNALREIGRKLGKNWDFQEDPCSRRANWVSATSNETFEDNVRCASNGSICNIVSISLRGQSLPGTLPPEFVNLRYLQNLDLSRNFLSGTIPREWGSMDHLVNISLLGNRLYGSIPKELGNITTLTTLNVEGNLLSGRIPKELGNLSGIERLFLNSNNFTGELPPSFANLTAMKEFQISDNDLSGKIPNYIGGWTHLRKLKIQASGLEGPIPSSITLLETLSDLRISDLTGPDTLCPPFSNVTYFKNLILRSCNLIGELPKSLAPNNLKVVDLSFNKLNGSIPESLSVLNDTKYIYLTGNLLSGSVPPWILDRAKNIDLSYNKLTFESSRELRCQMRETNFFASFSADNMSKQVSCLQDNVCATNSSSLYINCGGKQFEDGKKVYEADVERGGASHFSSTGSRWGFSNTGHFLGNGRDDYILPNPSRVLMNNSGLYESARTSALSLTYYGFCMRNGSYNVSLHFAEILLTDDGTYSSLGRRVFDIYIQGKLVEKDFDISDKAGGVGKAYVSTHSVNVTNTLEIRLYWAGKGTTNIPFQGVYGPLISAISVDPNYPVPPEDGLGNGHGVSRGVVAGIVVGSVCCIVVILGVLWWWGYLRHRDTIDLELTGVTGSFTLRQIKAATNNFDVANKIGEGGFGSVYKGVLPDGTLIAVKQLSSKSRQGNREFLNELGMISALQHPHLVKLHGCCIEGNQLLLAYEYMENNSLARALFGPKEWQLELDWPTRYRICICIAKGMTFLHEESRLKIVHRDIKATNVLLDKNLNAKISDFGLAKLDEEDNTHISTRIAGTYGYMAPEYALRGYLTDKADVYSYGIVLLEIVSGVANTVDRAKQNHFILLDRAIALKNGGNLMELVDPRLGSDYDVQEATVVINLALLCTTISPTDRPAMSAVVSMLEGRTVARAFDVEQSVATTEVDREKMMKQLECMNESRIEEMSIARTDS